MTASAPLQCRFCGHPFHVGTCEYLFYEYLFYGYTAGTPLEESIV